ncbi:MAG: response regulator [Candidatus Paceibacterota bacterium]|jgi:DNA-binding NarL/FixJ family response regulator
MDTTQKKIKILLIDSDEMMRIYFRDIFWIHGRSDIYEISMASSLEEAEKKITDKDIKPDTVFLDIMMTSSGERISGDEQIRKNLSFIERIKKDKDLSSIKIIIFSNKKEDSIKEEVSKLGVDGFLIKGELMPKEIIDFTDKIHEHNN